jgi:hypothetical protein
MLSVMYSINISKYTTPENYELSKLPAPTVEGPKDIVINIHAASINPIDVKKASGLTKAVLKDEYVFGFQCWYMTGSDSPWLTASRTRLATTALAPLRRLGLE